MGLSSICRGDGHTVDTFEEQSGNREREREMEDNYNPYLSAGLNDWFIRISVNDANDAEFISEYVAHLIFN